MFNLKIASKDFVLINFINLINLLFILIQYPLENVKKYKMQSSLKKLLKVVKSVLSQ